VPVIVTSAEPRDLTAAQLGQLKIIDMRLAAAIGPCFVDVGTPLAATDGRLATAYDSGDGVHPNAAGHLVIARQLRSMLSLRRCVSVPPP
jgi:lysophospholipase L1-like esterase